MAHLGGTFALLGLLALAASAQPQGDRALLAMAPRSSVRGERLLLPPPQGKAEAGRQGAAQRRGVRPAPSVYRPLREDAPPLVLPPLRDASAGVLL